MLITKKNGLGQNMPSSLKRQDNSVKKFGQDLHDLSIKSIIIIALSVINLFFGFIKFANVFSIKFFYFYSPKIVNLSIFGSSLDWLIWELSFLFILLLALFFNFRDRRFHSWFNYCCFAGLAVFVFSLFDVSFVFWLVSLLELS